MFAHPTIRAAQPRVALAGLGALLVAGCGAADRISEIGKAPELTAIENPVAIDGYVPVRMPMPPPLTPENYDNSLWQSGSRAFFRDQRASAIGDILTVVIEIDDEASINNQTERTRESAEEADLSSFLGLEGELTGLFPSAIDPTNLVDLGSTSTSRGQGLIEREEQIELMVAAVVTQILPNGNMVVYGRQELRVNFEVRELLIAGVIRPEDISSQNTISYEKIAEARVSYGGRGQITDMQQPRYGQQFYDIVFPF